MLILLADDHPLVREGLKNTLSALTPDIQFVEAASADEVLDRLCENPHIDLALLDLVMPGSNGFELLGKVCNTYPDLAVTILSGSSEPAQMRKALDIGASGFITKSASPEVMLSALRLILAGGIYVPPDLLQHGPRDAPANNASAAMPRDPRSGLTTRQREVLNLLAQGKSNKQIARELELSENTVKIHVTAVLRALGVNNRTQAAVIGRAQS